MSKKVSIRTQPKLKTLLEKQEMFKQNIYDNYLEGKQAWLINHKDNNQQKLVNLILKWCYIQNNKNKHQGK
jgi:hypothetical protein